MTTSASAPMTEDSAVARILSVVAERTGLTFPEMLRSHAEAAVRQILAEAALPAGVDYLECLRVGQLGFDSLFDQLAVKETYFLRDSVQFDVIANQVLPQLLRDRGTTEPVRVWSAGCATGEEAYSIAIVFAELGQLNRCQVTATDYSVDALNRARRAEYRRWSFRGGVADRVRPYVTDQADGVRTMHREIRERVRFLRHNLWSDPVPPPDAGATAFDIILCRNVLLYFPSRETPRLCGRLAGALAHGGWLITSASDPLPGDLPDCQTVVTEAGCFFQRQSGVATQDGSPPSLGLKTSSAAALVGSSAFDRMPEGWQDLSQSQIASKAFPGPESFRPIAEAALELPAPAPPSLQGAVWELNTMEQVRVALERNPLNPHFHLAMTLLLLEQGRYIEAGHASRRALFLDPTLVMAHFASGLIAKQVGQPSDARRAFRNAARLGADLPDDSVVPWSDGERILQLVRAAQAEIRLLETQ